MTDIRKDFEEWFVEAFGLDEFPKEGSQQYEYYRSDIISAYNGYQAGRAHDIEGLVAEIEKLSNEPDSPADMAYNAALNDCQIIIRKHFGKE